MFVQGRGDFCDKFSHLVAPFSSKKFSLFMFDFQGQGQSSGERGHIDHYLDFLDDLARVISHLEDRYRNIFVVGHSTGALILTLYLRKNLSSHIKRAVLTAPLFKLKVNPFLNDLVFSLSAVLSKIGFGKSKTGSNIQPRFADNDLTQNEEIYKRFCNHKNFCGAPTFQWVYNMFLATDYVCSTGQLTLFNTGTTIAL